MAHSSPSTLGGEHSGAGPFKRKLDALGYTNTDGTADTPLMRQVVDDLIHTTDCYLALKQQASSGIQHLNHLTDKVSCCWRCTVLPEPSCFALFTVHCSIFWACRCMSVELCR